MCSTIMYTIVAAFIFIFCFFPFLRLRIYLFIYIIPDGRIPYMHFSVEVAFMITTVGPILIEFRLY